MDWSRLDKALQGGHSGGELSLFSDARAPVERRGWIKGR
ncbi:unnamed protein product [Ciceribacter selenitireducens ATCC BAA-1503]|uniref:Uncharacterized protein n=1 Tax=Ciceribacter selenitireducens ATCC BAA-1503 TaxID=1336235 RepID=A0A376AFX9_9HYPH|nr:unnamed protein product [Ciceribacter selenitireducens ATCC BAA-1503]